MLTLIMDGNLRNEAHSSLLAISSTSSTVGRFVNPRSSVRPLLELQMWTFFNRDRSTCRSTCGLESDTSFSKFFSVNLDREGPITPPFLFANLSRLVV